MSNSNENYCDELTASILDFIPPLRIVKFKSGEDCINDWVKENNVKGNISYFKNRRYPFAFYYTEK